jgi:hypothetical protein
VYPHAAATGGRALSRPWVAGCPEPRRPVRAAITVMGRPREVASPCMAMMPLGTAASPDRRLRQATFFFFAAAGEATEPHVAFSCACRRRTVSG